jgi:hypothetical protein
MSDASAPRHINRRLTARVACHVTTLYRVSKDWHPATAMDISASGCRLRLGEDLSRGTRLTVRVQHPGKDGAALGADVPGTVIWSRLEGLSHQAGVQFEAEPGALEEILRALG